ncbi:MAG: NAD(P)/FAD-dependent oxidoreductase [bacterium]
MRLSDLRVAVVGGAIGGSATALLFARAGAAVTVIERVEQPRAAGAGIGIAENGMAVLASLGLRPALDVAKEVPAAKITDARGRTLLAPPQPAPRIAMVRRSTLYGVLLDAVAAESRIVRRYGACVRSVDATGSLTIMDASGEHTITADLIVGADGVHSTVRGAGTFGAALATTGIRYVRGIVASGVETGVEAWTSAGVFGSFAVDGGTYFYASCGTPAARAALDAHDLSAFQSLWADAYLLASRVLSGLRSFDDLLVNEVRTVKCDRWHDGHLVLLGDAAHAMAPNLGQGANSALVDAAVLLDELRRGATLDEGLHAYETRRRAAVTKVATLSERIGRLAELTQPALRGIRDRVLMPVAGMMSSAKTTATVLQESPGTLFAIGRT